MGSVDEQGNQVLPGREIVVTDMRMGELETSNHRMQDIEGMVHHRCTISDKSAINVQVGLSVKLDRQESYVLPINGLMFQHESICKQDRTKYKVLGSIVHTRDESGSSKRVTNICVIEQSKIDVAPAGGDSMRGPSLTAEYGGIRKLETNDLRNQDHGDMVQQIVSADQDAVKARAWPNVDEKSKMTPHGGSVLPGSEMMTIPPQGGSVLPGSEMMTIYPQGGSVLPRSEIMVPDVRMPELETLHQQTQALADTFPQSLTISDQSAINFQRESSVVEHGKLDMAPLDGDSMLSPTKMVENGGIGRQETFDIDKQDADNKVHQIVTDQGVAMARKGSSVDDKNKLDVHSWGGSSLPGSVLNGKDGCICKEETSYKQNLGLGKMFQHPFPLVARMKNVALGNIPRYDNFHKNASHNHAGYHKQVKSDTGNMTPGKLKKGTILASYISTLEDDKERNLEKQNEMDEVEASSCMYGEVTIQQPPEEQKSAFYLTSDKAPLAENGQKFTGRKGRKDNS